MGRLFNIVIFILLLGLVVLANGSFLGIPLKEEGKQKDLFNLDKPHTVIYTLPAAKDISGYGGAIPMAIAIDAENVVLAIEVLKNSEDPNYLGEVLEAKYLNNWIGLPMEKIASLDVDAISGATLSSTAIAKSMKIRAKDFANISHEEEQSDIDYAQILKISALIFVILSGFLCFYFPAKFNKYRIWLLVANVLVLGIWQGAMLSVFNISNWLINGVSNIYSYCLLGVFLLSILVPLFTKKNYYCMYCCPFGASQELVSRTIKINKISISKFLFKGLERARIIILLACFILLVLGLGENIALLEPFSAFSPEFASKVAVAIFVVALILSMFTPRVWCRYFCPCGAFLDLFKRSKK